MKIIWYVARKDLLQVIRDKSALVLMLVVPLALISVMGFALGNLYNGNSMQISIKVALSNQDTTRDAFIGKAIADAVNVHTGQIEITVDEYTNPAQVINQVTASKDAADVGLVIPKGASQTLLNDVQRGIVPKNLVQFYTLPNNNDARIQVVQDIVNSVMQAQLVDSTAISQVHQVCSQPGNHCAQGSIDTARISASLERAHEAANATVQSLTAGHAFKIDAFDQEVPGYAIFFSLFGLNAVAATILKEKEDGTFRRLLIAPIQKYSLLAGKMLAQFLLTLAQLSILFLIGYFVFKMHIGNWPAVILLVVGTSFAATGLGIMLVSLVRSRRQIDPVLTLVTLGTSALGGAWWPLFLEPSWMQQVAKLGITAWAMEGLNGTMIFGKGFMDVLPDILGLLAYGTICFIIGLRLFRFQEKATVA